jgi:hypothetical protein
MDAPGDQTSVKKLSVGASCSQDDAAINTQNIAAPDGNRKTHQRLAWISSNIASVLEMHHRSSSKFIVRRLNPTRYLLSQIKLLDPYSEVLSPYLHQNFVFT